ncbi:MAG: hypothetical protein FJ091_06010 [Deltaproteobacteria bacterium]|nr:hypothetical protein [Deltaproteobacteria bacterium]
MQNVTISQMLAQLAQVRAQFQQLRGEVNQCLAVFDADGDGEPNATDRCPGSQSSTDESGCTLAQFCAAQPMSVCARADFNNDQPGIKKPGDCFSVGGACTPF